MPFEQLHTKPSQVWRRHRPSAVDLDDKTVTPWDRNDLQRDRRDTHTNHRSTQPHAILTHSAGRHTEANTAQHPARAGGRRNDRAQSRGRWAGSAAGYLGDGHLCAAGAGPPRRRPAHGRADLLGRRLGGDLQSRREGALEETIAGIRGVGSLTDVVTGNWAKTARSLGKCNKKGCVQKT